VHRAASQHMHVQVVDSLAAIRARIHHHAKPTGQFVFRREFGCDPQHVTEEWPVRIGSLGKRGDVLAGNDQQVYGRPGGNIEKRHAGCILMHHLGWNLPADDLAE